MEVQAGYHYPVLSFCLFEHDCEELKPPLRKTVELWGIL